MTNDPRIIIIREVLRGTNETRPSREYVIPISDTFSIVEFDQRVTCIKR